jgi:hypothetical protein
MILLSQAELRHVHSEKSALRMANRHPAFVSVNALKCCKRWGRLNAPEQKDRTIYASSSTSLSACQVDFSLARIMNTTHPVAPRVRRSSKVWISYSMMTLHRSLSLQRQRAENDRLAGCTHNTRHTTHNTRAQDTVQYHSQ